MDRFFHGCLKIAFVLFLLSPQTAVSAPKKSFTQFQLCSSSPRINCVVDGDTFWLNGEKIRLADVDTPETFQPQCAREHFLGKQATNTFIALLNLGPIQLQQKGRNQDRYGRSLRIVERNGQSLGQQLIDRKLAVAWTGRRGDWCG